MSVTPSAVLTGLEEILAAVSVTDGAVTIGGPDDNADEVLTAYRTHVVPTGVRSDRAGGAADSQSILTFDVVVHVPRTAERIKDLVDAAVPIDAAIRRFVTALVALDPPISETNTLVVVSGADIAYADVVTASWRCTIKFRST